MFGTDYFVDSYFAPVYFPNRGAEIEVGPADLVELTVRFCRQMDLRATIGTPLSVTATIREQMDMDASIGTPVSATATIQDQVDLTVER